MWGLIAIALLIAVGIYYVTKLHFEIGTGFSEEKDHAREGEGEVVTESKDEDHKTLP